MAENVEESVGKSHKYSAIFVFKDTTVFLCYNFSE